MISISVEQCRGKRDSVVVRSISVQTVPAKGDLFEIITHDWRVLVSGRVEDVHHVTKLAEGGGTGETFITVTLTGWKTGFGKD